MSFSADAVANEFLRLADAVTSPVSPMKIQKLVYYAHGWHLAIEHSPLIREGVQAWKYGPVIQSLYREFKEFGTKPITRLARELRTVRDGKLRLETYEPFMEGESRETVFAKALVSRVWDLYGNYTGVQLSRMTHEDGTPWYTVAAKFNFDLPSGISIPNELIEQYFTARLTATPSS